MKPSEPNWFHPFDLAFPLIRQHKLQVKMPGVEYFVDSDLNWFHLFDLVLAFTLIRQNKLQAKLPGAEYLTLGAKVQIIGLIFYCQGLAFYLIPIIG